MKKKKKNFIASNLHQKSEEKAKIEKSLNFDFREEKKKTKKTKKNCLQIFCCYSCKFFA